MKNKEWLLPALGSIGGCGAIALFMFGVIRSDQRLIERLRLDSIRSRVEVPPMVIHFRAKIDHPDLGCPEEMYAGPMVAEGTPTTVTITYVDGKPHWKFQYGQPPQPDRLPHMFTTTYN